MNNEKECVYNLNRTMIYKNIGLHVLYIMVIMGLCTIIILSNDVEKLKIEGTLLMYFGISSIMFIPFLIGQIIGIIFEMKNLFYQKNILRISKNKIQYNPYYIKKVTIEKDNIERIYNSTKNYIAIQLKDGIDIKTNRWCGIFRKLQLSHCIYICCDEVDCENSIIRSSIEEILNIKIDKPNKIKK